MVKIFPVNSVFIRVECNATIASALSNHFMFEIEGARYHPAVKARAWDGMIRLFNAKTHLIYRGLLDHVVKFCQDNKIDYQENNVRPMLCAKGVVYNCYIPDNFEKRDYQIEAFDHCVKHQRALMLLPTGSGKSLVIYWLVRWYGTKTLIIVDSLNLLSQMYSDFEDYGYDSFNNVHRIKAGSDKDSDKPVYITTWQSAAKQPKKWFDQFKLVIGDECHLFEAKSFRHIMENLTACPYRFGFTGTLSGTKTNQMVVEGLFGPQKKIVTTKKLMDQGHLSALHIKCLLLRYPDDVVIMQRGMTYPEELDFLYTYPPRNAFIRRLATSLKGNTLLLFQRLEQHGVPLYEELLLESKNVPVYYVSGQVEGEEREAIRKIVNTHENSITVASVGTFARGVNIPNIHNIIVAAPSKSQIRVLQSIGRGLRKSDTKTVCQVYDIADDLSEGNYKNFTLRHFWQRKLMYVTENFAFTIYNIFLHP